MFCTCGKQKSYTAMHEKDENGHPIPSTFIYSFWVCANCMRPSQRLWIKMTNGYAPLDAVKMLSSSGDGHGRHTLRWATTTQGEVIESMVFHPFPRRIDLSDQGRDIVVELWRRLDTYISLIRANPESDTSVQKSRASELASAIALIMSPFYTDETAVLQESMIRWTARQENRIHESPGLAEGIWDPNSRFDGTPYSRENEAKVRAATGKKAVVFDDTKITFIKHCISTGSQTPEVLAGMFGCSVEDIRAVIA